MGPVSDEWTVLLDYPKHNDQVVLGPVPLELPG